LSKGFAFLSFQSVKVAHLALTSLAGQLLAGKQINLSSLFDRQLNYNYASGEEGLSPIQ